MEVNEENETLMKQHDREKQRRKEIEEVCIYSIYSAVQYVLVIVRLVLSTPPLVPLDPVQLDFRTIIDLWAIQRHQAGA